MNHQHSHDKDSKPIYLSIRSSGKLRARAEAAYNALRGCTLCPRNCRVDRTSGALGACKVGSEAIISSSGAHFGEESVLVGKHGSGTIFFTWCNLSCVFCQNYNISTEGRGRVVSARGLADMMIDLQEQGCHNINLVSPSHQVPQILEALDVAIGMGLRVPIVYNSGGYDSVETLRLLDGVIDIYMPDIKYGDNEPGRIYSGVADYWDRCREAVKEMYRQVGDLITCEEITDGSSVNIASRGLLVRHLVLPENLARTDQIVEFLAKEISSDTFLNIMSQYRPEYQVRSYPELTRRPTADEMKQAFDYARAAGLHRFAG